MKDIFMRAIIAQGLPHYNVRSTSGYYYSVRSTTELFIPHPSIATHLLLYSYNNSKHHTYIPHTEVNLF